MNPVYLGMGSNLGDRQRALSKGLQELEAGGVSIVRLSSVYDTDPVGFLGQGSFLNLAVEARWTGTPEDLLDRCLRAEEALGRVRGVRDGPRTLDVDILLMGPLVLHTAKLQVPHPRMTQRRFVLVPLEEIAPETVHPVSHQSIRELLRLCRDVSGVREAGILPG